MNGTNVMKSEDCLKGPSGGEQPVVEAPICDVDPLSASIEKVSDPQGQVECAVPEPTVEDNCDDNAKDEVPTDDVRNRDLEEGKENLPEEDNLTVQTNAEETASLESNHENEVQSVESNILMDVDEVVKENIPEITDAADADEDLIKDCLETASPDIVSNTTLQDQCETLNDKNSTASNIDIDENGAEENSESLCEDIKKLLPDQKDTVVETTPEKSTANYLEFLDSASTPSPQELIEKGIINAKSLKAEDLCIPKPAPAEEETLSEKRILAKIESLIPKVAEPITNNKVSVESVKPIICKPDTSLTAGAFSKEKIADTPKQGTVKQEDSVVKPETILSQLEKIVPKIETGISKSEKVSIKPETFKGTKTTERKSDITMASKVELIIPKPEITLKSTSALGTMSPKLDSVTISKSVTMSPKPETITSKMLNAAFKSEAITSKHEVTITKQSSQKPEMSVTTPKVKKGILSENIRQKSTPSPQAVENAVKAVENNSDIEMVEIKDNAKTEPRIKIKVLTPETETKPMNGDVSKDEQPSKRRASDDIEADSPLKRLCQEVEKTFPQHDTMINEYIQNATKNNVDEIQRHTEQLLAEIQTLRELAQKKEHEWNNILHLKKVKEEILLRLLRRKQVISFEKAPENDGERKDPFDYLNPSKSLAIDKSDEISGLALKQPTPIAPAPIIQPPMMPVTTHFNPLVGLPPPYDKVAHMQAIQKQVFSQNMMMAGPTMPGFPRDMNGQLPTSFGMPMGRQGPTKDVKSIIADYRQRNPDVTPRRGRRMKSILNPGMMNTPRQIAPKVDNLNNLGMIFNNLDMNQKAMLERLSQMQGTNLPNGMSFKDVLVQYASMQQPNMLPPRPEMMAQKPEPRPEPPAVRPERRRPERQQHQEEVQISVKERVAAASPRLPPPPPYPEISLLPVNQEGAQGSQQNSLLHGILTKNCGEITITPVAPAAAPDPPADKPDDVVQLDDEESPPSEASNEEEGSSRLVIDEGSASEAAEGGEEAPLCQGCRRRPAQFVCAGCANQWYCSRDCQVAAWDDHSDMCSG